MEKDFSTISHLLNDDVFKKYVLEEIESIKTLRKNRPMPKDGFRYKKDWYDKMNEADQFNFGFIIKNIEEIWFKKSLLNSHIRNAINRICLSSVEKTAAFYSKKASNGA